MPCSTATRVCVTSRRTSKRVPVTVTYQPVLLNNDENGNLWVTAFADHYKQAAAPAKLSAQVKDLASRWSSETGRPLDEKRLLTAVQGKPVGPGRRLLLDPIEPLLHAPADLFVQPGRFGWHHAMPARCGNRVYGGRTFFRHGRAQMAASILSPCFTRVPQGYGTEGWRP